MKRPTQNERILEYLEQNGTITPYDAFNYLGITKLATRISEMKKGGIQFKQEYITKCNPFGETIHYMQYSLRKEG